MPRRVLAKKITRKQAEAYQRTVPNPMGVTAIAAVNDRGAYQRRYEATREMLKKKRSRRTKNNRRRSKKASASRGSSERNSSMRRGTSTSSARRRRRATPNRKRKAASRAHARGGPSRSQVRRSKRYKSPTVMVPRPKRKKATSSRRRKATSGRKKTTSRRRKATSGRKRKSQARVYGKGRYKTLRARIGPKTRPTYMYETKKGNVRKIPKHAYLGYASAAEMRAAHKKSPKRADRDRDRWKRAEARRGRQSIAAVEGRSPFTPNRRRRPARRTITFEEWEKEMKTNARRRRKKTTAKRRRPAKKRTTTRRRATTRRATTTRRRRKTTAKRRRKTTTRRKATRRKTTRRKATRRKTTRRRVTRRASTARKTTRRRRKTTVKRRRSTTKRRRVRRNGAITQVAANRRRRRKSGRRVRRNAGGMRGFFKRGFLRNAATGFTADLLHVLKIGGVVLVGYIGHRALTRVISDTLLANVEMFKSGGGAAYKDVAAGAAVAVVGIPLAAKFAPKDAKLIGAGIAASWLQNAVVTVLAQMGQTDVVAYLGDYTEAEGNPQYSGYGSYYEFTPGQVFGEYYTSGPMSGFGDIHVDQLTQAAAGMGGPPQLYQAAAAYNGMGDSSPMLTQAAAGMGEYIVQGANGIGEYEQVTPQYTAPAAMDEGISPDLTSAERALSVAEAAAGIGAFGDSTVPLQSTVYPTGQPEAIPDMPGGSRAGTFAGNNGIFGAGH